MANRSFAAQETHQLSIPSCDVGLLGDDRILALAVCAHTRANATVTIEDDVRWDSEFLQDRPGKWELRLSFGVDDSDTQAGESTFAVR